MLVPEVEPELEVAVGADVMAVGREAVALVVVVEGLVVLVDEVMGEEEID